jgi:hypothetical protein
MDTVSVLLATLKKTAKNGPAKLALLELSTDSAVTTA